MGISVSAQAQNMYNAYALANSDTYKDNEIDSSTVSKEKYNVSNLTNALDTLDKADSVSFESIGNVDSYSENVYKMSQLDEYDKLSDTASSNITDLISGSADLNDIYKLIGDNNSLSTDEIQSLLKSDSSASSKYSTYLTDSGSLINTLA
jgi:hypothetical protein